MSRELMQQPAKQPDAPSMADGLFQRTNAALQPMMMPLVGKTANGPSSFAHDFSRVPATPFIQAKLTISQPGDPHEQEADRVADSVMQMPSSVDDARISRSIAPLIQREESKTSSGGDPTEQEDTGDEPTVRILGGTTERRPEGEETAQSGTVQRKETSSGAATASPSVAAAIGTQSGQPLPAEIQSNMGQRFGADFRGVRIHTDQEANALSRSIAARAFTHQNHIYFAQGEYQPSTQEGQHLLAHELTHTIQQGAAPSGDRSESTVAGELSRVPDGSVQRAIDTSMLGASYAIGRLRSAIPVSGSPYADITADMVNSALDSFGARNPVLNMRTVDTWYYYNPMFYDDVFATRSESRAALLFTNNYMQANDVYTLHFNYRNTASRQRQGSFTVAAGSSVTRQTTVTGGAKLTISKLELSGSVSQQTSTGSTSQTTVTATNFYEHDYDVTVDWSRSTYATSNFSVNRGFFGPKLSWDSGPTNSSGTASVGSITVYDDDSNPDNLTE